MAGTATLSTVAVVTGLASGSKTISPPAVGLVSAVGQIIDVSLVMGDNTITVPPGSTYAIVAFPITAATVKLKNQAGDSGNQLLSNPAVPLFMDLPVQGASALILNASAPVAGVEVNFL